MHRWVSSVLPGARAKTAGMGDTWVLMTDRGVVMNEPQLPEFRTAPDRPKQQLPREDGVDE